MRVAVQLPAFGVWTALEGLRRAIAGRNLRISARRSVPPVMAESAHAEGAFRHGKADRIAVVSWDASMMPDLRCARLLRVQCCGERVYLALELGDATVGLLLSLSCWWSGDACTVSHIVA